jgi:polyribonucleotide nucleotidyltransferase
MADEEDKQQDQNRGDETSTTMEVGENAGLVIGRGGSTIQAMQRETGARLFVDNATRVLHLSGTADQVERAHKRISELLERVANSPR